MDPDGRFPDIIWDVVSVGMGVRSFAQNVKSGNVRGAVGDALGITVDVIAAAVPFVPGGVGAIRAGANAVDAIDNVADASKAMRIANNAGDIVVGPYSNIPSSRNVGQGKRFTPRQKQEILKANMDANDGVLRSDGDGRILKSAKGQKADMNQAEVDHIIAKSKGGTNDSSNAQVLSKEENLKKSNK